MVADERLADPGRLLRRLRLLRGFLAVLVVGLAVALWFGLRRSEPAVALHLQPGNQLMDLGPVADFALTDSGGEPFLRSDLDGKMWVVNFIFTRCNGPCPRMTEYMRGISNALIDEDDVRFLSISVDPEYDQPAVLAEFAQRFRADTTRWSFVTGDREEIFRLAKESFYLSVADAEEDNQVIHSTRFIVLDPRGSVRASHDEQSNPGKLKAAVIQSVHILLSEAGATAGA